MAIPAVITYAYIRGKWYAFSDQASAREGATRYQGNIRSLRTSKPVGVLVDDRTFIRRPRSFWPQTLVDVPGVTGDALINPPYNPITRAVPETPITPVVTPTTVAQAPSGGGGGGGNDNRPPYRQPPPFKDPRYASYVNRQPGLSAAYQNYRDTQQSDKIDKWERASEHMAGRRRSGPEALSKSEWGRTHWEQYGEGEENRKITPFGTRK